MQSLVFQARAVRAPLVRILSDSPWPLASVGALYLCGVVEQLAPYRALNPAFVASLAALMLLLGLIHGALWSAAFWLLRRFPAPVSSLVWFAASFGVAGWLAQQLGAFTRLHSRYSKLAIAVFVAAGLAGLLLGSLCSALQPTAARPDGYLLSLKLRTRRILALLLMAAFVALQIADRRVFPSQYPLAHTALRVGALWCAMFALALAVRVLPRAGVMGWALGLSGYAVCLLLLDSRRIGTLSMFDQRPWASAVLAICRTAVDFDRDGHANFLGDSDCAPWNRRVHPGAHEIPDNGIDDNCIWGDASLKRRDSYQTVPESQQPPPLDVVLITVDAFNPRHLGLYNPRYYGPDGRDTSPNLDRWAQNATVFERAYSPGGWTSIAVPALLRGVYPRHLRWRKYYETNMDTIVDHRGLKALRPGEQAMHMFPFAFNDPHPTLPEMMLRRGYATLAVTDDGISSMLQRGTGVDRGFQTWLQIDDLPPEQRDDAGTAKVAIETLASVPEEKRFFMWVHFFGTHYPDTRHEGIRDYGPRPVDTYDHEVAFLDKQLIRFLDAIASRKHPVAVLISADHSEGLNAVTRYHGDSLDEPVIRVPLLARVPGWPTGRNTQVASSVDLVPTILSLVGSPLPPHLDGMDLGKTLNNPQPRVLFSDTWRYDPYGRVLGDFSAAYDGSRKFVLDRRTGGLYSASQTDTRVTERLIGMAPIDSLSSAVYAYLEESGELDLTNE